MSESVGDVFAELRQAAIDFRDERDWAQYHEPKDLALGLSIEAAELSELFLWKTRQEARRSLADDAFRRRLSDDRRERSDNRQFCRLSHWSRR